MKIIHFHPDARMAEIFIAPLMEAERAVGHATELLTSLRRPHVWGVVIPFDLSVSNLLSLPLALWKIRSHLKSNRPDVVFSHNTKSSFLPLLGAWWAGVRVRVYYNHGVPYVGYGGVLRWLLRMLERLNCGLATHVLTVSRDMIPLLQDVSPSIKPRIIRNGSASGVDMRAFTPGHYAMSGWRAAHGLRGDDMVVVYVGRPEKRKGFAVVLQLWTEYFHDTHFKLVLCGPSPDDVLRFLPEIPTNVRALGFVNNVPEVLAWSNLMLLPSLHEGLSYACIEAQASGVVAVANEIHGVRCLIEHGVNGFLVINNNLKIYNEIIRKIDNDKVACADIQRRARTSVEDFSRENFIPAYLTLLNSIFPK